MGYEAFTGRPIVDGPIQGSKDSCLAGIGRANDCVYSRVKLQDRMFMTLEIVEGDFAYHLVN
jgi:hypothetical protein